MKNHLLLLMLFSFSLFSCKPDNQIDTKIIGNITVDLDANKAVVRTREALIGNLISDAFMAYAKDSLHKNPAFALMNGGNIRFNEEKRPNGIYQAGDFTENEVNEILFYDGTLYLIPITGRQLKEILERSVSSLPTEAKGWFLQCSKELQYTADLTKQPQVLDETNPDTLKINIHGERITSVKINGQRLSSDSTYTVLINSYPGNGEDGYVTLGKIDASEKKNINDYRQALIYYLKNYSPLTPKNEKRITIYP